MKASEGFLDAIEALIEEAQVIERIVDSYHYGEVMEADDEAQVRKFRVHIGKSVEAVDRWMEV